MPDFALTARLTGPAGTVAAERSAPFRVRDAAAADLREAWGEAARAAADLGQAAEDLGRAVLDVAEDL